MQDTFDFVTNVASVGYLTHPREVFSEMHRVLKRGGTYIVCSYGVPASRVTYLKKDTEWLDVEIKQIGTITRV